MAAPGGKGRDNRKARRQANRRSAADRLMLVVGAVTLVILAAAAAGTWWWIERDNEPVTLRVGTGPFGSDSWVLMREVADVAARHNKPVRLDVRATRDPSQNIAMLNAGQIELAAIRADTPVVSTIRMVADLYPDYFQFIVRADAPLYSLADLSRARIAIPAFGTDAFRSFWVIANHYNFALDGIDWTATGFSEAKAGLLDGTYDAIFTVRSLRDAELLRLFLDAGIKHLPLRYLPVDQAKAITLKSPFLQPDIIPPGAFTSYTTLPGRDVLTASVMRILVTRDDIPDQAIRALTEVLFEHRLDLTIRFSLASAIRQPDESHGLNVPLHDGAAQFYSRDEPSFLQENAEPLALVITVCAMLFSALLALRSRLVAAQKNRADRYNYQLLDLNSRAFAAASTAELAGLRSELNEVLETVVVALDTDEVTDEGFQSFSLLWENVRDTIREREAKLSG